MHLLCPDCEHLKGTNLVLRLGNLSQYPCRCFPWEALQESLVDNEVQLINLIDQPDVRNTWPAPDPAPDSRHWGDLEGVWGRGGARGAPWARARVDIVTQAIPLTRRSSKYPYSKNTSVASKTSKISKIQTFFPLKTFATETSNIIKLFRQFLGIHCSL